MTDVKRLVDNAAKELNGRLIVPYQRKGVEWILNRELPHNSVRGGILADEVGLGKTVQMLAAILGYKSSLPTLILCPKSLVSQWEAATLKFTGIKPLILTAMSARTGRETLTEARIIIAPYTAILPTRGQPLREDNTGIHNKILATRFQRVVLDEGHHIKNDKSKVHQSAKLLRARIRWILTATPVARSTSDIKAMLDFIGVPKEDMGANMSLLRDRYVLRRTQEDIAAHTERLRLPPINFETLELEFSEEEQEIYDALKDEGRIRIRAADAIGNTEDNNVSHIIVLINKMRMLAANPAVVDSAYTGPKTKLEAIVSRIASLPRNSKSLVFTHWNVEADELMRSLEARGITASKLCGSMSGAARDRAIEDFKGTVSDVLISHIEVGGVGLNLQNATHVFVSSFAWNASSEVQAIGRAHRTGVDHVVNVIRYIVRNTVEEHVVNIQQQKLDTASSVLGDHRIRSKLGIPLTVDDFKKIFE